MISRWSSRSSVKMMKMHSARNNTRPNEHGAMEWCSRMMWKQWADGRGMNTKCSHKGACKWIVKLAAGAIEVSMGENDTKTYENQPRTEIRFARCCAAAPVKIALILITSNLNEWMNKGASGGCREGEWNLSTLLGCLACAVVYFVVDERILDIPP